MSKRALACVIAIVAAASDLSGCNTRDDSAQWEWATVSDSTATHVLARSPSVCSECIRFERQVVLGDTVGPGYLRVLLAGNEVARDSVGNYWVGQRGRLKVFDAAGNFLRTVGRSGRGPMDFQRPNPAHVDSLGRVHIIDIDNLRLTVVDTEFNLAYDQSIVGGVTYGIGTVHLPKGDRYAVNMLLADPDRMGLPIHIIEGSEVVHSFGKPPIDRPVRMDGFGVNRALAVDRLGHLFSAHGYEYEIEVWTDAGRRIIGFDGPLLNAKPPAPEAISPDNPFPNRIADIHADDAGRLWVVSRQRRDDWLDAMVERVRPDGMVYLALRGSLDEIFTSRIDVIDLNTASIVAVANREELFSAFVDDTSLVEMRFLEDGTPQLAVWSVGVNIQR